MQKLQRLAAIEKIISAGEISSQEELAAKLKGEGIICTQATLSRNLRQIGVIRVPGSKGSYVYSLNRPKATAPPASKSFRLVSTVKEVIDANSMIVIKTVPGYANSIAVTIDNSSRYEIAGTIAGDDTLLVIPRDGVSRAAIHACLELIIPGLKKQLSDKQ
jgi:transcriptional regulator of arginine metabolism